MKQRKNSKQAETPMSENRSLILRTCAADMSSHGGFIWPRTGRIEAPDWKPTVACGNGLHGFLHGEGSGSLASWEPDAVWIAAWVPTDQLIDLDGKVKFPWAEVAVAGTREEAIAFLRANGCAGAIVGDTITGGYGSTITGGYRSTITGGDGSTITARYWNGKKYRTAVFEVGEDGVEANQAYRCDETGKLVKVSA